MSSARLISVAVSSAIIAVIGVPAITQQGKLGSIRTNSSYQKLENWPQVPAGIKLEACSADGCHSTVIGVLPDSHGNVWMLNRSDPAIMKIDQTGKMVHGFGNGMFVLPHGFCMDADGNLWAGDSGASSPDPRGFGGRGLQFFKFSPEGKLLMTLGKAGVAKVSPDTFIAPMACTIAPNGDIIIADGHIPRAANQEDGDRLVRFSKDGKFIRAYGKTGSGPGEFRGAHQLAFDSRGRLFVADRSNNRIQIFDENMNFVAEWRQFGRPSAMTILKDDTLVTSDWESGGQVLYPDWPGEIISKTALRNPQFNTGTMMRTFGVNTNTVRVGSSKDGSVVLRFETPRSEALGADIMGNIYTGPAKYVRQ